MLDIGCGWGGFLQYAAQHYGVQAVGITVSREQMKWAQNICRGLPVEIRLQDYRDLNEKFDHIVSLGMFEHVGQKNYCTYMNIVHRCLKDKGLFFYKRSEAIKRVFLSILGLGDAIEGLLVMEDCQNAGTDYDKTLMSWFDNFDRNWSCLEKQYDQRFYRMWKYYLLSCAGLFRARKQQLWRIVLTH